MEEWSHGRACAFPGQPLFKDWGHRAGHCALTQDNSKGPSRHQRSPRGQLSTAQLVPLPHLAFLPSPTYQCQVTQSCPALCDPMDCSPSGSSVHRILQAKILEWVAMPFSRGYLTQGSNLGLLHYRQIFYHLSHHRSPRNGTGSYK